MGELLQVNNLEVSYPDFSLHPLSFSMKEGEILSIIGESGSGKTTIAKAVACIMGEDAQVSGSVIIDGNSLLDMKEKERKTLRMTLFSVVFQNATGWLNPSMNLRGHLQEVLKRSSLKSSEMVDKMESLMTQVGLKKEDLSRYPRELSGGMVQRFLLANALALSPKLVILDEPTSALDADSSREFVTLIQHLNQTYGTSFLLITHDLQLANSLSERMMVLYRGHVQEMGNTQEMISDPHHPYTYGLLRASTHMNLARDLWGIRRSEIQGPHEEIHDKEHHGCPFYGRCTQSIEICGNHSPHLEHKDGRYLACNRGGIVTVLEGKHMFKAFGKQKVIEDVSIKVRSGEIVSIIGASGVGKTTLAHLLSGMIEPDKGEIEFQGQGANYKILHRKLSGMQMVIQDSQGALNPHMTVEEAVAEPLTLTKLYTPEEVQEMVKEAMEDVELPTRPCFRSQKVQTVSGGQKQRITIARALTMKPALLIADEPTALLDVSSKANLLRMLKGLQNRRGLAMLMITHDLECAFKISDRILQVSQGQLVTIDPEQYVKIEVEQIYGPLNQ